MTRMCKNGCDAPCYPARLVCKRCVADESLDRKRRAQGQPMKQGRRPSGIDGNVLRMRRIQEQPLDGFNPMQNEWAKRSLRVSA